MPSLYCRQQHPLSPIPPDHMSFEAEILIIQIVEKAILEGAVGRSRSTPNATNTTKSKEGQTTVTVSVPPDSNKQKTELNNETSQPSRKNKCKF